MKVYEHNQWALVPIAVFVLVIIGAAAYGGADAQAPLEFLAPVILAILAAFARMTTRVDENGVRWAYTLGVPRGSLSLNDIDRVERARTNVFEGWGVRWTPWHGWLWNVSGFDAVEFFLKDGRRLAVGTDDPDGFMAAINAHLSAPATIPGTGN